MKTYSIEPWKSILSKNGYKNFHELWHMDKGFVEEPNQRRGGWSGVTRFDISVDDNHSVGIFLKRQCNHVHKTFRHPVKGAPTFSREMKNILRFRKHHIPTVTPLYFHVERDKEGQKALLMTEELSGYRGLDAWIEHWSQNGWPDYQKKKVIIRELARTINKMHTAGIRHGCLYFKHVFLKYDENSADVKLIDLEKARYWPFPHHRRVRDLAVFIRHANCFSRTDKLRFLFAYLNISTLSRESKKFWHAVGNRDVRKRGG